VRITSHDLEADGTVTESVNVGQWYLIRNGDGLELDAQDVHDVTASGT
jgi:hypothetical protein